MEARLNSSSTTPIAGFSSISTTTTPISLAKVPNFSYNKISPLKITSRSLCFSITCLSYPASNARKISNRKWVVLMENPSKELTSKPQIIDYYVGALERVLGSEQDAQMCIYDASCHTQFGFCCDVEEEIAHELAGIPGVVSVKPDLNFDSLQKDPKLELNPRSDQFCAGTMKPWIVEMGRPAVGVIRKASVVNYFVQVLMRVLGNEKDAQMCMYHISWESNYGFCCILDDECSQELSGVPGVMSVLPDGNFGSDKNYVGQNPKLSTASEDYSLTSDIKTKKLFVTGLSFYTSEKTLYAAFEGFGKLTEVKIIMDKISKRSKGYAFVEYTTEDAASTALREMNGKIINGWMITVDVAKKNPPRFNRGQTVPNS